MNALILNPFIIPAGLTFLFIVFIIAQLNEKVKEERGTDSEKGCENKKQNNNQDLYDDNFLDFSGGCFGI